MKLLLENWNRYLEEELLTEVSFEQAQKRFESKSFLNAI